MTFARQLWLAIAVLLLCPGLQAAELKPAALLAYRKYVRLTEARIDREQQGPSFFWGDRHPEPERLRRGEIIIDRLTTLENGNDIKAPGAMIHHWAGYVFLPRVTLRQYQALAQDYAHHQQIYAPDVARSRLLRKKGNDYRIYLRFYKKKIITVVLNTEHEVQYRTMESKSENRGDSVLDPMEGESRSHAVRIAEVEHPGQPDERERPLGDDGGFLWGMDSFWRYEERDGGLYLRLEVVSMSRDIPFAIRWLVGPFITSIPRDGIYNTLQATRRALAAGPTRR